METNPHLIIILPFRLSTSLLLVAHISIPLLQWLDSVVTEHATKEVLFHSRYGVEVQVVLILLIFLIVGESVCTILVVRISKLVTCLSSSVLANQNILLVLLIQYLADCISNRRRCCKRRRCRGCGKVDKVIDGTRSALVFVTFTASQ